MEARSCAAMCKIDISQYLIYRGAHSVKRHCLFIFTYVMESEDCLFMHRGHKQLYNRSVYSCDELSDLTVKWRL